MRKNRWIPVLWIGVLAFLLLGAAQSEKSYHASRFDVDVVVEEGGAIAVTETAVYDFQGGPFTYVFRELPTDHTDGIVDITARLNGRLLPVGENAGQVEISGNDPIRITWHFEPTGDASQTVELNYRVLGVARQSDNSDAVIWQALPDEYDFAIDQSTTTLTYPSGLELTAAPEIQAGQPAVAHNGNQVTFTSEKLSPGDPLVVGLYFPAGSLISQPPEWQAQEAEQVAQAPWWLGTAVAFYLIGAFAIIMEARKEWPRARPQVGRNSIAYEPPDKLAPGLAGTLTASNISPNWHAALGILFDLAERGVVEIDESPEKKWYRKHDFLLRLLARPSGLELHESALLDLIFTSKKGPVKTVKFSDLSGVVSSGRWREFTKLLKADMKNADLIHPARQQRQKRLNAAGIFLMIFGVFGLIMGAILSEPLGVAAIAPGVSLMLLGITAMIAGSSMTALNDAALQRQAAWQQFRNYLKQVSKGKESVSGPQMFLKYLPYAAAFGLLGPWTKHFEKEGWTEVPPYFHALPGRNPADSMAAFAAMSAVSASSGGAAAAGAAGAGAAGGGAAGAG